MLQISNEGATVFGRGIRFHKALSISMTLSLSDSRIRMLLLLMRIVLVAFSRLRW